ALFLAVVCRADGVAHANPYLAKPGEPAVKVRIGACAITGGFIHLYTALDNRLFDKYGINAEHIVVRGGAVAMAGLASDEINFLYRLAKEFLRKFNLSEKEVTLATVGGTPTERYTALVQDMFQATLIQPPLDARGRKDGFNIIYNLNDLGLPFIYSSLFASSK